MCVLLLYFSIKTVMSAKTGASIKEILQCSICLETFTDPKVLPCIHTFCFQCLQTLCNDNAYIGILACPLCRYEFCLSAGRIQDLPNNFVIDQLMQAIQETPESADITDKTTCELCLDNEIKTTATAYCFECEQYICD